MEWVAALLFVTVVVVLLAGFPVAFTLGGTALLFAWVGMLAGSFPEHLLFGLPNRVFGIMGNETLVAVPLFVFMGVTLERAPIAEELLDALSALQLIERDGESYRLGPVADTFLRTDKPTYVGGMTKILEAVRQLRGEAHPKVQVKNCDLAIAHGTGGLLGVRHAASTCILERA